MQNQGDVSPKQFQLLEAVRSRKYKQIYLVGALGTSKTYIFAMTFILMAKQYPNSYIPIARKTLAEVRVGTIHSFLEVLDHLGYKEGQHYRFVGGLGGNDMMFRFPNGSIIQFLQLDHTKDREWQKIKSINATAAGVDEVDGVQESGFIMLNARVGRKNQNGAPDIMIATCNPNETWVKENIYIPWRKGMLPKETLVLEFEMKDSFLYKDGFYNKYKTNPKQWQQRYLYNNWDYLDDDASLFKSRVLDEIMLANYKNSWDRFVGVDVGDEGKDRTVFSFIIGNTLADIKIYTKDDLERLATNEEKTKRVPYGHVIGRELIKYCADNKVGYENTAFDAVGIGTSLRDYLTSQGFYATEFKAGERSEGNFDMIRSEAAVGLAESMENGEFFFYDGCPHLGDLKKELLYHQYEVKAKVMCVESKKGLRLRLGRSPDIADSLMIAYWAKAGKVIGTYGPDVENTPIDEDVEKEAKPFTAGLRDYQF